MNRDLSVKFQKEMERWIAKGMALLMLVLAWSPGTPVYAGMAEKEGGGLISHRASPSNYYEDPGKGEESVRRRPLFPDMGRNQRFGLATDADAQENWNPGMETVSGDEANRDEEILDSPETNVYPATYSNAPVMYGFSPVGDLWEDWNGKTSFRGHGTREAPYQISSLAELMGLSEAVAAGEDFKGLYLELTQDLDLDFEVRRGNWNPIGWYQGKDEFGGEVRHPFRGSFDGCGHTISGLRIIDPSMEQECLGLFGVIDGGCVHDLTVKAKEITGKDSIGILAGKITGNAVVAEVTVSGSVFSDGSAGGIAGEVLGKESDDGKATLENCRSENIVLNSSGAGSYVGGIAGKARKAYLVDNIVLTQNGDANRIQGKGYVGGIAGCMEQTDIYNSYVDGTIGGNASLAVGGIVGEYISGSLVLARMAGDIGRTNQGAAKREGIIAGTRDANAHFTYGTGKNDNLSYLYTVEGNSGKAVFGSTIDGDNGYTKTAHIGYWTDNEKKYVTVAGKTETGCGDRYFYEELEDGVRYIVTQKLSQELTADDYAAGLTFHLDHFAPGYMGEPVRGYLVYVPVIHAVNANGTLDTDVASLAAIPAVNSSYYRTIDKDHAAAVVPGALVTVLTAPSNTAEDRYQMAADPNGAGGTAPPTYTDAEGEKLPMNYTNGGSYSFVMPACDTELNVQYVKVTTKLASDPEETTIQVIQTRRGDRKKPDIVTEVKNTQGNLIARYIQDALDTSVEVHPVTVHAEHNGAGKTADRSVQWFVDDSDLIINQSEFGYTEKDARILPNIDSDFIQGILRKKVGEQADGQYQEAIDATVYSRDAVVTAMTNPDTSIDNIPVYANCKVHVTFQILDETTLRVEGMSLNRGNLAFTVTRKLSGSRYAPTETITCSAPVVLTATLEPVRPFLKQVNWKDQESGKILALKPGGNHMQDCTVSVRYDPSGKSNPAWIQNVINADNGKRAEDHTQVLNGSATHMEVITVTSEDQTHGNVTVACPVTVKFVTVDETALYSPKRAGSSGGSGGSGSSGGSGGGSSMGAKTAGATTTPKGAMPSYVVTGTWIQNGAGRWMFADNTRTYAGEWAAVHNPYADTKSGQKEFDWFYFDQEGLMACGWHTDMDGSHYYLNPDSDGTQGRMVTGWKWIDGYCYYFNEQSDGTKGALWSQGTTPDGYQVDDSGRWVVDGIPQRQ